MINNLICIHDLMPMSDAMARMMATIRVAAPERNRPFLSTIELFALKTAGRYIGWRHSAPVAAVYRPE